PVLPLRESTSPNARLTSLENPSVDAPTERYAEPSSTATVASCGMLRRLRREGDDDEASHRGHEGLISQPSHAAISSSGRAEPLPPSVCVSASGSRPGRGIGLGRLPLPPPRCQFAA